MKFTDGVEFDLSGPLRVEERHDGFYVVGHNMLIPVKDNEDGNNVIKNLSKGKDEV